MNYYNYFTEIEEHFVRRRAKNVLISPLDWSLIDTWRQSGIPLAVVLRGIDRSFEENRKRPRPRNITSLYYCYPAVMEAFQEYLESHVGKTEQTSAGPAKPQPFSNEQVQIHLRRASEKLEDARAGLEQSGLKASVEAIDRALHRLEELVRESSLSSPDFEALESSLVNVEDLLAKAIAEEESDQRRQARESAMKKDLRLYRKKLKPEMYQNLLVSLRRKRIQQEYNLPPLSLFSL